MIELNNELSEKIREIKLYYSKKINDRIIDFMNIGRSDNRSLFIELSFCILTANTSAEMGIKTWAVSNTCMRPQTDRRG